MLFRRQFTHCAMAIPFTLYFPSIFLKQGVNLIFKGDDSLLQLLLITLHKNWLAHDVITVAQCFHVYFITS